MRPRPPKVPCVLRSVDDDTADALALAENFVREPMHPLDEAEAFAKLAREEAKGVESIAAEFGVSQPYVRQRMKLATLAEPVKAAYRQGGIDTATAEAFASVPPDRQLEVWQEVGGNPQHAQHVRNVIAHAWIDAASATFDLSKLPDGAVSRDLFAERVLVERKAFMEAQAEALAGRAASADRRRLGRSRGRPAGRRAGSACGDGRSARRNTTRRPRPSSRSWPTSAASWNRSWRNWTSRTKARVEAIQTKLEALDDEEQTLTKDAEVHYAEATKAVGTAFLLLDPDGRVRREYRIPANPSGASGNGHGGQRSGRERLDGSAQAADIGRLEGRRSLPRPSPIRRWPCAKPLLKDAAARKRILAHDPA